MCEESSDFRWTPDLKGRRGGDRGLKDFTTHKMRFPADEKPENERTNEGGEWGVNGVVTEVGKYIG